MLYAVLGLSALTEQKQTSLVHLMRMMSEVAHFFINKRELNKKSKYL